MNTIIKIESGAESKSQSAYSVLRRAILTAELMPGTPLRFEALSEQYGLGRTPAREALARLEAEHLVSSQHNRGFVVAPVGQGEIKDLTLARIACELPLLQDALTHGKAQWEDRVVTSHYRLSRFGFPDGSAALADLDEWSTLHNAFHDALLSSEYSWWLTHFHGQIQDQLQRIHRVLLVRQQAVLSSQALNAQAPSSQEVMQQIKQAMHAENHRPLMEAALARDIATATTLYKSHLMDPLEVFERQAVYETD